MRSGGQLADNRSDAGDGRLRSRIVRAAKACDPFTASALLVRAITSGLTPGAEAFGAAVVASTNVRDLTGAEAWIVAMRFAGHTVSKTLAHEIAVTALRHTPRQRLAVSGHELLGPVPTLEEVGRWLWRLNATGVIPMTADIANEIVSWLGAVEIDDEACEWAGLACRLAMQELANCDDAEFDDMARRGGVVLFEGAPRGGPRRRRAAAGLGRP